MTFSVNLDVNCCLTLFCKKKEEEEEEEDKKSQYYFNLCDNFSK